MQILREVGLLSGRLPSALHKKVLSQITTHQPRYPNLRTLSARLKPTHGATELTLTLPVQGTTRDKQH